MTERHRFDVIDQEQLAAQLVAVMDAHFQRPSTAEKRHILMLASQQLPLPGDDESFPKARSQVSIHLVSPS